jgi:aspartate aminotransferase-like enzyme
MIRDGPFSVIGPGRPARVAALLPGPTVPWPASLAALAQYWPVGPGTADYLDLVRDAQRALLPILGGPEAVILAGPGALGTWAALASTLRAGDRVLVVDSGPLAEELAAVAGQLGADLRTLPLGRWDALDPAELADAAASFRPDLVALALCEPARGLLLPVAPLLRSLRAVSDALVCLDARAAAGAMVPDGPGWGADLCLASAEHALSTPADLAIVLVGARGWARVEAVDHQGFAGLQRWRRPAGGAAPYGPAAGALAALAQSCRAIDAEGLPLVAARHVDVARYARDRLRRAGLELVPADSILAAPTVTAFRPPVDGRWPDIAAALAERGVVLGAGRDATGRPLLLLGHLGSQADLSLVKHGLDAVIDLLAEPAGA